MKDYMELYDMMRQKGLRITSQKKILLQVFFENRDKMLSVSDVYSLLPDKECMDNATVYRNIQKFLEFGFLEAMNDENGINRYTLSETDHHHYLICTECGKIIKIPCDKHFWETHTQRNNFIESHHRLEIYGKCSECSRVHL